MTIGQVALDMWPCWALGILMLTLTWKSEYRNLIRVEPKGVLKFAKTLAMIIVLRMLMLKFIYPEAMVESARYMSHLIPWQSLLGTFWEDACHTLPLALAGCMWGASKWYPKLSKVALVLVALSFGSGHIYQGIVPAVAICFYIPVTLKLGKKYGFGTVMLCHIMYDLATLLSIKWMLG